jgi:hypothetical protein
MREPGGDEERQALASIEDCNAKANVLSDQLKHLSHSMLYGEYANLADKIVRHQQECDKLRRSLWARRNETRGLGKQDRS